MKFQTELLSRYLKTGDNTEMKIFVDAVDKIYKLGFKTPIRFTVKNGKIDTIIISFEYDGQEILSDLMNENPNYDWETGFNNYDSVEDMTQAFLESQGINCEFVDYFEEEE